MDDKTLLRGLNTLRAIEANARISKVLLHELHNVKPEFERALEGDIDLHGLRRATEKLIEEADAVHDRANQLAKDIALEVPPDDADGVILVVQCCGGK